MKTINKALPLAAALLPLCAAAQEETSGTTETSPTMYVIKKNGAVVSYGLGTFKTVQYTAPTESETSDQSDNTTPQETMYVKGDTVASYPVSEIERVQYTVPAVRSSCPTNTGHPHAIDLGLDSGIKWACCNVGADTPTGSGKYYAWGETTDRTSFNKDDYKASITANDIQGTDNDVAKAVMNDSWVMPTKAQMEELINGCTWGYDNVNGGWNVTGKNGNSIFLPAAKFYNKSELKENGHYWASTHDTSDSNCNENYADYMSFNTTKVSTGTWGTRAEYGMTVRAVVLKTEQTTE